MPLIAAASINIDVTMFLGFALIFLLIAALVYLGKLARDAVRHVCMNDDKTAPRRRTHLRHAAANKHRPSTI